MLLELIMAFKIYLAYHACRKGQVLMEENVDASEFFLLLFRPLRLFLLGEKKKKKIPNPPLAQQCELLSLRG